MAIQWVQKGKGAQHAHTHTHTPHTHTHTYNTHTHTHTSLHAQKIIDKLLRLKVACDLG